MPCFAFARRLVRDTIGFAGLCLIVLVGPVASQAAEGRPCKAEPTEEVITYGDLINCTISPVGDTDTFRFVGLPSEAIAIQAARGASGFARPCIELYEPDGALLSRACTGGTSNRIDARLRQAGTHTILVSDSGNLNSGTYALALERVGPAAPFGTPMRYGQVETSEIDLLGDLDAYVFTGVEGSKISAQATRVAGFVRPCVEVFGPDGISLAKACEGGTSSRIDATLTQGGTHTLLVSDSGALNTGTYSVTLQCLIGSCTDAPQVALAAAVLPSSRSVQVGAAATAFATIINTGSATATAASSRAVAASGPDALGCGIVQLTGVPTRLSFQATDPATNRPIGSPNMPVNILFGRSQSFVISLTPDAAFCPTDVQFGFTCSNGTTSSIVGLNTLLVTASATPVPDIIALAATTGNDGIVRLSGPNGFTTGAFAVATANVGASGTITAFAAASNGDLPISLALCQTDAAGSCLSAPTPTVTTQISANATPTFAIFVTASGVIPFDPASTRIFVRFSEDVTCGTPGGTVTRGSTSVAVRTE
jgi:hypothetical protein